MNCILRTQSDARLAELARHGHESAFDEIVRRYQPAIGRYCRRRAPDSSADDVVQQTFINAWAALSRGADVRDVRPWLYTIAQREAHRVRAQRGRDPQPLEEGLAAGESSDPASRLGTAQAMAAVADLPARQRAALVMSVGGYRHDEVAGWLGLTDGAVRQLVHRARETLRAAVSAVTPWPVALRFAGGAGGASELGVGAGSAGLATKAVVLLATVGAGHAVASHVAVRPGRQAARAARVTATSTRPSLASHVQASHEPMAKVDGRPRADRPHGVVHPHSHAAQGHGGAGPGTGVQPHPQESGSGGDDSAPASTDASATDPAPAEDPPASDAATQDDATAAADSTQGSSDLTAEADPSLDAGGGSTPADPTAP